MTAALPPVDGGRGGGNTRLRQLTVTAGGHTAEVQVPGRAPSGRLSMIVEPGTAAVVSALKVKDLP